MQMKRVDYTSDQLIDRMFFEPGLTIRCWKKTKEMSYKKCTDTLKNAK